MSFRNTKLGLIPEEWNVNTMENSLGEIIDYRGKTPKKSNNGIVTLSARSVKNGYIDYASAYYISKDTYKTFMVRGFPQKGDILLTTEAPLGYVAKLDRDKVAIAQRLFTLRGKENYLLNDYLRYYLMSPIGQHQLKSRETGTTVTGIKQSEFRKVLISIPSIKEQKVIAIILSCLDDKIELNNKINKNLEEMAQGILKRWFVDFEFPNENGEPYKSSGGEMIESELGKIPIGWEVIELKDIMNANPRYNLIKDNIYDFVSMKELNENNSLIKIEGVIKKDYKSGGMKFTNGDTLFARITPCLENGKTGFIDFLEKDELAFGSTEFIVLRMKKNIPKPISYIVARNEDFRRYAIKHMTGSSGRQRVNKKVIEQYNMVMPKDLLLLKKYGGLIKTYFNKILVNSRENYRLSIIRDTLLPKLMSGEIRVPIDKEEIQ